jgi:CHAT domain-containing protein
MRVRNAGDTHLTHQDLSISLVGEEVADDSDLPAIPEVGIELQVISSLAKSHKIRVMHQQKGSTTISSTSVALQAANIVHLACHGIQDDVDATQSGFYLGDGRLTISHLMDLHIKEGFLAFLSACETAKGCKEQPDQAMHLAAAMLFSGFKSVIATLWYRLFDSRH